MTSSSFPSSGRGGGGRRHEEARNALRDREAADALRVLGFWEAESVVREQGHERVLAAVAYVRSRRNVKGQGAYVRRLLREESIPAPLLWEERPSPSEPVAWQDYRSLDGHQPLETWPGGQDEEAAALWSQCLGRLESEVTRPAFEAWLRSTVGLAVQDGELVVGAADAFVVEALRGKMKLVLSRTASVVLGKPTGIRVVLFEGRASDGYEADRGSGTRLDQEPQP